MYLYDYYREIGFLLRINDVLGILEIEEGDIFLLLLLLFEQNVSIISSVINKLRNGSHFLCLIPSPESIRLTKQLKKNSIKTYRLLWRIISIFHETCTIIL